MKTFYEIAMNMLATSYALNENIWKLVNYKYQYSVGAP